MGASLLVAANGLRLLRFGGPAPAPKAHDHRLARAASAPILADACCDPAPAPKTVVADAPAGHDHAGHDHGDHGDHAKGGH
jgi:hypothetical protein